MRHGGGQQRVDLEKVDLASATDDDQLLAVNDALDKLAAQSKPEAELVKLRYFVGMTSKKPRMLSASPPAPLTTTGPTPGPGCLGVEASSCSASLS